MRRARSSRAGRARLAGCVLLAAAAAFGPGLGEAKPMHTYGVYWDYLNFQPVPLSNGLVAQGGAGRT